MMNIMVSGTALLLACIAFFTYDIYTFQRAIVRSLTIQAKIIGANTASALLFDDPHAAEDTLGALRASSHIRFSAIYTPDGHPFAVYWSAGRGSVPAAPTLPPGQTEAYWFSDNQITLVSAMNFQGKEIGTVYIRSDLNAIYDRLKSYSLIALAVLLISLFAALVISRAWQRSISVPIVRLAETARNVSRDKNYSVREPTVALHDELATLIDAFNEMLTEIQQRESALQQARDKLESRVKERTAELEEAREGLRVLSGRLLRAQDEERRRVARELHDSSGQVLAALAINLAMVQTEVGNSSPKVLGLVSESIDLVQATLKELRTMSYLLHPPLLDEAGLESALRWFVDGFSTRSHISVSLSFSPDLGRLPGDIEMAIFRIVQESLTNIHRHSNSSTAEIVVVRSPGEVQLEISDSGSGMQLGEGTLPPGVRGVGIRGMEERARQAGGSLVIQSSRTGTTVVAIFPVD
jgi:signal transduction histidine kinase